MERIDSGRARGRGVGEERERKGKKIKNFFIYLHMSHGILSCEIENTQIEK